MTNPHYISLTLLLLLHTISHQASGFQVRLIHRESPASPFYNPRETKTQRIGRAVGRTVERVSGFDKKMNNSGAEITTNSGEYLLNISIGSPGVEIMAIADTGSDLVWTQCKPCEECFEQRAPLFDPSASSTYTVVPCESATCSGLPSAGCTTTSGEGGSCEYSMQYGDNSFTQGTLSADVMKLGSASLPRGVFGCGFQNGGTFNENGSGIIGLGGGPYSAARQFTSFMDAKFSYCLRPWLEEGDSSPMSFGEDAEVTGDGKVSTPMVSKDPSTFYFLTLKSITVDGSSRQGGEEEEEVEEGNIIIDSGTTVTILPPAMYSQLEAGVMDVIKLERGEDPQGMLSLCYKGKMSSFHAPPITAHFHGADLPLTPLNTFFQYSHSLLCLSFIPGTPNGVAIFGNLAQINLQVEYDLRQKTVSFKPANCSIL